MFTELEDTLNGVDSKYKASSGAFGSVEGLVGAIANLMIGIGISVAMITLAYAFIQFTMSEGDPKKMDTARKAALWSMIAFLVSGMAWIIRGALYTAAGIQ